ncbi:endonuclease/exonuclease/phosphatase family protein [Streptomyces sp. NBC_01016]|uniref:endonuclease/exonuclease/phosphatase family protein n=1 Tax=Streptomyces sp. NBC_01016 TaxID=2903720 RepID=UPI0022520952|nr:endonuclease/exonuclease/phosphatase family protein [Streptomyces sp. NBC_01016]MCX4831159.1 endonuclease/exonuclease/phosphatase family protein [Streptomyces sp. NBC_01016]
MVLIGPSTPSGALVSEPLPLPVGAAKDIVPGRVMTWNICNPCGSAQNLGRAADIATYAPQVVGLQEACVRDVEEIRAYLKTFYGLTYRVEYGSVLRNWGRCGGLPWRAGGYGQAILSAAPMTDPVTVEYPDGGSEDRGYLAVTTSVGGRPVRVFNTHLAQREQESFREKQVSVFAKAVARHERTIVLGDFNAVPDAPELAPMWSLATDADPRCRPTADTDCGTTTDWYSKFDYIFLRGFDARTHAVHPSAYSDHHSFRADLENREP